MGFRLVVCIITLATLISGCQQQPPTVVVKIVTATPSGETIGAAASFPQPAPTETNPAPTAQPTPTPDLFPTPVEGTIQVAEQPFEHGRMFWIQPRGQIWVMIETEDGHGRWRVYEDTFEDGQPEYDPAIVPPAEGLYQPERGFGKLWREQAEVREALGWAVTPDEFGYVSRYEYHLLRTVDEMGTPTASRAGYHILFSLYEEPFRFNEADGTWQAGRDSGLTVDDDSDS